MSNFANSQPILSYEAKKGELGMKLVSPRKVLLFWEISDLPLNVVEHYFEQNVDNLPLVVRIYDVTGRTFNGSNAHYYHEIVVPYQNGHWYIKGLLSNRSYTSELGVKLSDHEFFPFLRSEPVNTPMFSSSGIQHGLSFLQQIENSRPKWVERVSTYSFYEESKPGAKNE